MKIPAKIGNSVRSVTLRTPLNLLGSTPAYFHKDRQTVSGRVYLDSKATLVFQPVGKNAGLL